MTPEVRDRIDQIRQGIVPEGYKNTKFGILPDNWSVRTIAECLERVERPVDVQANKMYTQIGIRSHGKGLFYKEPVTGDSLGNKAVFWIEPNCFILNIVFAWEQAIGKTTQAEVGMIGSHRFPMYRPTKGNLDIDYLIFYLLTKRGTDILEAASPGGAGRNRTLGQDRFMKSRVVLPPLDEQKKIAAILATQDKTLELQARKIDELKRFKKGCMERMFPKKGQKVPEKRFPGFAGDWEQRKFEEIAVRSSVICSDDTLPRVEYEDIVSGTGRLNKDIYAKQSSKSGIAFHQGDVLYGKLRPYLQNWLLPTFDGLAVGDFWVLQPQNADSSFLYRLIQSRQFDEVANQSTGTKMPRADWKLVSKTVFSIPSNISEQAAIGTYFTALDSLITLHQRQTIVYAVIRSIRKVILAERQYFAPPMVRKSP